METLPDATSFGPSTQSNFDPSELHPRPCKKCNCNRTGPVSYFLFLLQRPWDDVRSWCVRTRKSDIRHLQTSATNSKAVGGVLCWSKIRNLNISFFHKIILQSRQTMKIIIFKDFFQHFKISPAPRCNTTAECIKDEAFDALQPSV